MKKGINPKDTIGSTKIDLSLVPSAGLAHTALALMNGDFKYSKYNWREKDKEVQMSIYISAIDRHLQCFKDGEDVARDSLVHHLGHIAAGAMILLDAIEHDQAVDDRVAGVGSEVLDRLSKEYKDTLLPKWTLDKNPPSLTSTFIDDRKGEIGFK